MCIQHVVNAVEVEKFGIVEETVQRMKPIIQEKINQETKQTEVSLQFTNKVVDISVVALRQIRSFQKTTEISQLQVKAVDIPVVLVVETPLVQVMEETAEIPQLQVKLVDVPVVFVVPVPQVQVLKKTVEDPQLQIVEKTVENPETQIDTCLTCDAKCMVACETCVKDNMFMVPGEITVAGKMDFPRETLQQNKIFRVIKKCLEMTSGAGTALSANGSKRQQHTQGARQAAQKRESEVKQRGEQGREEREEGRKGQRGRDQEGRKEERGAEEAELVEKDVTGWTEVTRKKKKMVQIFVKVDGGKTSMMEMKMSDKVDDIVKKIPISDQDVYVTSEGRVLRGGDELRKCGVRDGCTVEVMRRMRGGGRHKDKKNKVEKKQVAILRRSESPQAQLEQKDEEESKCDEGQAISEDVVQQVLERGLDVLGGAEALERLSEGSDDEVDKKMELFLVAFKKSCRLPPVLVEELEKLAKSEVTARRAEMKSQAAENVTKNEDEAEKVSRKAKEEQSEKVREQSTDVPDATSGLDEARTGRGNTGLVRGGGESCQTDETRGKGKGKGNGGKGEHGNKGGLGSKGTNEAQQSKRMIKGTDEDELDEKEHEEDERVQVAPNMGAGGSHPQATTDPGEEDGKRKRWADFDDEDEKQRQEGQDAKKEEMRAGEREDEVKGEKVTGKEETTDEKPPGLEDVEKEPKTQEEEKQNRVESEQEAQEEEKRRALEAREQRRALEAREEERRVHEAREEKRRAQEAREERRTQEAQEEERAPEAPELRRSEREVSAQKERREQESEVEAQGGREQESEEVRNRTQEECVEEKREGENRNQFCENSDVSNRHMTWWRKAWWIRIDDGSSMRSARGRRRVWRAARRAAEQARDGDRVEETHCLAEEAKWEKWGKRQADRQCTESTLHLVLHLPQNATATATTQATATATAGPLQQQQQQQQQQSDEQDREGANFVQSSRQRDCAPSFVPWDWRSVAQ